MRVDYGQLALCSQTLRRQGEQHLPAISRYVQDRGILTPADTGMIMMPFTALSLAIAVVGVQIADGLAQVMNSAADKVDGAAAAYAEQEKALHDRMNQILAPLGGDGFDRSNPGSRRFWRVKRRIFNPRDHGDYVVLVVEEGVGEAADRSFVA